MMSFSWSQEASVIFLLLFLHTLHAQPPCRGFDCFLDYLCSPTGPAICACNDASMVPPSGICPDACVGQSCKDNSLCYDDGGTCVCNDDTLDLANCPDRCENLQCVEEGLCQDTPTREPRGPRLGPTRSGCSCTFTPRGLALGPSPFNIPTRFGVCLGRCTDWPCFHQNLCRNIGSQCICNDGKSPLQGQCDDACEGRPCREKRLCDDIQGVCSCQDELLFNDENDCVDACAGRACVDDDTFSCAPVKTTCSCRTGLVFAKDESRCIEPCAEKACLGEGTCTAQNGECICNGELRFDSDRNRCIDDCDGKDCAAAERCAEVNQRCTCLRELIFDDLEMDCIDPCNRKLCLAERTCVADNGICTCLRGLNFDVAENRCIDSCDGKQCKIDNTCEEENNRCVCRWELKFDVADNRCIDPCAEGSCEASHVCSNTVGSYTCLCRNGYFENDQGVCEDVNECASPTTPCSENSECVNEDGTFRCEETTDAVPPMVIYAVLGVILGVVLLVSVIVILYFALRPRNLSPPPPLRFRPGTRPFPNPALRRGFGPFLNRGLVL